MSKNAKVAWVPPGCSEFLTELGVKSQGGRIIETNKTGEEAFHICQTLNRETRGQQGNYIVVEEPLNV